MSNDHIVEELRECATHAGGDGYTCNVMRRAAAEIKQLREVIGLAAEFDAAPDDAEWEPPHPIFQMAQELDALAAELQALKAPCSASSAGFAVVTHHGVPPVIPLAKWHDPDDLMTIAQHERIVAAMADELEQVRTALGGMLFAFDDGVGRSWSKTLLDFARKLASAKEYKS